MAYFGCYNHQLDQKNRIRIPAKLKAELGANFTIVRGSENCLYIYSEEQFSKLFGSQAENISAVKEEDLAARKALRVMMRTMDTPEEDNQGRFILNANLRGAVGIKKDIVFIGMLNRIELWSKEVYDREFTDMNQEDYDKTIQALGNYGI